MSKNKTTEVIGQVRIPLFDKNALHLGFIGTRKGLTREQFVLLGNTLKLLIDAFKQQGYASFSFHHGDCVGADKQFHEILRYYDELRSATDRIIIHPPEETRYRAYCNSPWIHEPKPYLVRNRDIVDQVHGLIACPDSKLEKLHSGTWSTIRYARKHMQNIIILYPNGEVDKEVAGLFV